MRYSHRKLVHLVSGLSVVVVVLHITSVRQPIEYRKQENTLDYNCHSDMETATSFGSPPRKRINDPKVERLIEIIQNEKLLDVEFLRTANFTELAQSLGREKRNSAPYTNNSLIHTVNRQETPNHLLFHYGIQKYSLYNPDDPAIEGLLHDMANLKITTAEMMETGSELKLLVGFIDDGMALLKFMRNKREFETSPDRYHFEDFERHNAEIAAFHLSKTLGFYIVPPVSGRMIDLTKEIVPLAQDNLNDTFYYSAAGNLCFWGSCEEYCDSRHSFCGNGSMIEASMMAFLPPYSFLLRSHPLNPYSNTYSRWDPPIFATYANYCTDHVLGKEPIETMDQLLNVVDLHIFDFLQGNRDRHNLNYFTEVGLDGFLNAIDNGRAFGKTKIDEDEILAPLLQCCKIRESTLKKFVNMYVGPEPLSEYFDKSMKSDPLYPILVDGHLTAVDRRATRVLRAVMECLENGHTLGDIVVRIE